MSCYFDTSALVKVYHDEAGSAAVRAIYQRAEEIVLSELAKIEFLSTAHRKYRERQITHETLLALTAKFEADVRGRYTVLPFSPQVIKEAWHLLRRFAEQRGLRTLDSLQLAFFAVYCGTADTSFVCADATLGEVAQEAGFQVMLL